MRFSPSHGAFSKDQLGQIAPMLASLIGAEVEGRSVRYIRVHVNGISQRPRDLGNVGHAHCDWLSRVRMCLLLAGLAVFILAPRLATSSHHLRQISSLNAAFQCFPLRIVRVDVERSKTDVAQAQGFVATAGERATAIAVQADPGWRTRGALQIMMSQMGVHIAKPDDLAAQVALGCAASIDQLMRSKAGEHDLRIRKLGVRIALLRDKKMAESTEDQFARAIGSPMLCESRKSLK